MQLPPRLSTGAVSPPARHSERSRSSGVAKDLHLNHHRAPANDFVTDQTRITDAKENVR
jgi:hypothetical protein